MTVISGWCGTDILSHFKDKTAIGPCSTSKSQSSLSLYLLFYLILNLFRRQMSRGGRTIRKLSISVGGGPLAKKQSGKGIIWHA